MAGWRQAVALAMTGEEIEALTALSRSLDRTGRPGVAGSDAARLGASRRTLSRRGRNGRSFIVRARRPYARTNQRAYQASLFPAHRARHCPA